MRSGRRWDARPALQAAQRHKILSYNEPLRLDPRPLAHPIRIAAMPATPPPLRQFTLDSAYAHALLAPGPPSRIFPAAPPIGEAGVVRRINPLFDRARKGKRP